MNITVYIHPKRLVVATWKVEDLVPVLCGYKELAPSSNLDLRVVQADSVSLILHTSSVRMHWYPVGAHEDRVLRTQFEQSAWYSHQDFVPLQHDAFISTIADSHCALHACVSMQPSAAERVVSMTGNTAALSVDLDMDIQAALRSTKPRPTPWLLVGMRGSLWHAIVINTDHRPCGYAAFPNDDEYSFASMLALIHRTVSMRYDLSLTAIMIFGEAVALDDIEHLKNSDQLSGLVIARSQPFKRMRSMLDAKTEQRIVQRAHVIAPIAGSILVSNEAVSA